MKLLWTEVAEESLAQIEQWLKAYSEEAAAVWVGRIRRTARTIPEHPWRGRIVPEVGDDHIRELFVGRYRLWYRVLDAEQAIHVLLVVDGRREIPR